MEEDEEEEEKDSDTLLQELWKDCGDKNKRKMSVTGNMSTALTLLLTSENCAPLNKHHSSSAQHQLKIHLLRAHASFDGPLKRSFCEGRLCKSPSLKSHSVYCTVLLLIRNTSGFV